MLQVREAQQDHDRRRFKFSGRDFVSYFIELLYFCKKYVIISGYILGIMSAEQTLYQRRFVLSESETKTISNHAHPPEGCRDFGEGKVQFIRKRREERTEDSPMSIDKNSRAARQMKSRGKRPPRGRRRVSWKAILLAVILILAAAACGAVYYVNYLLGRTQDVGVKMEEMTNPNLDKETEQVQKGFWKVAVFGVDSTDGNLGKGANSDVIIICSLNWETGEIKMASVYRDTYLKVGEKNPYRKINEAYARGGPEQAIQALNENLDIAVDDYIAVNWAAVADAINNLGGVDIEVTKEEFSQINGYITSVVENTGIYSQHLKKPGYQHLDGVQAVAYCRLRKMDSDFQRTERQRKVISQCLEKAKNADLRVINTVIGVCLPQVSTSIGLNDLLELGKSINDFHLGETTGFPFDLKTQNIGSLDCVVPVTLSSNVVKLHQFLFGTENYKPSNHVEQISQDIAYNSAQAEDEGEEIRQEEMERMTSAAASTEEETEKSSSQAETGESETSSESEVETETDADGNVIVKPTDASDESAEGENPLTESDEYVPEDELINDPGLITVPDDENTKPSSGSGGPGSTGGSQNGNMTIVPTAPVRESESRRPGSGPGSFPESSEESETNATVYYNRPVETDAESAGIEDGPGYFTS